MTAAAMLLLLLCLLSFLTFNEVLAAGVEVSSSLLVAFHHHHHHHYDRRRRPPPVVVATTSRTIPTSSSYSAFFRSTTTTSRNVLGVSDDDDDSEQQYTVQIKPEISDDKIRDLFAWIALALKEGSDPEYNNLMLALAAVFGTNLPTSSKPMRLLEYAKKLCPTSNNEEELVGIPYSLDEREINSLGAMGAAQWTGQFRTRPHSLLDIRNFTTVDDWVRTLHRGCKRTIKRSLKQNYTVTGKPIYGDRPAPHSALAHFRCVVQHEVRLLLSSENVNPYEFLEVVSAAISRYMGTTSHTGEIREYRSSCTSCESDDDVDDSQLQNNETSSNVIAIAHEIRKGRTVRGQWFYAADIAAKQYVWFHSVYDLVKRAIADDRIDVVDLGPSGSDSFTQLKEKYGFVSVDDWPAVANYDGPFWYDDVERDGGSRKNKKGMAEIYEQRMKMRGRYNNFY